MRPGFANRYSVVLLFDDPPALQHGELRDALLALSDAMTELPAASDEEIVRVGDTGRMTALAGGATPVQLIVARAAVPEPAMLAEAAQQSWTWREAGRAIANASHAIRLSDFMAQQIHYTERLELFHKALAMLLRLVEPVAIVWEPTSQIVPPADVRDALDQDGPQSLYGALNIRLYRIEDAPSHDHVSEPEFLMDTLGLSALGLDDLQIHFRLLEPAEVARNLHNVASYLYERGAIIDQGHAVGGIRGGEPWKVTKRASLASPDRTVLHLDPGPPYAVRLDDGDACSS